MASRKGGGKPAGRKGKRNGNELDEMSDDMTQRGEAAGLGDDEKPDEGGEIDEVVEVAEIEGELIPEGRETIETEAEEVGEEPAEEPAEQPRTSGTGRGKQGSGGQRRQRRASKPRTRAKSTAKSSPKKRR